MRKLRFEDFNLYSIHRANNERVGTHTIFSTCFLLKTKQNQNKVLILHSIALIKFFEIIGIVKYHYPYGMGVYLDGCNI